MEHAAERNDLAAALVDAVADDLVDGVEGRGNIGEGAVLVGLLYAYLLNIKAVVHLKVATCMGHVEGVEARLRVAQGCLHLAGLQHLSGVVGRDAQGLSAVDDILAQAERQ